MMVKQQTASLVPVRRCWRWTARVWLPDWCWISSCWPRRWRWRRGGGSWLRNSLECPDSRWKRTRLRTATRTACWTTRWDLNRHLHLLAHRELAVSLTPCCFCPDPSVHVEAGVRLPPDLGRPRGGQLPRRDPGAPPGPGQDEEPHHQEVEAPDRHAHPRQLPRHPPQCRLLPHGVRRLRRVSAFIHVEEMLVNWWRLGMDLTLEAFFGLPSSGQTSFGVLDRYARIDWFSMDDF